MLTGHGLFEGQTAIEWLTHQRAHAGARLAMVRPPRTYPELDDLLQRCLAIRASTAGDRARARGDAPRIEPTLRRPPGAAAGRRPGIVVRARARLAHARPRRPAARVVRARSARSTLELLPRARAAELATTGAGSRRPTRSSTRSRRASSAELAPAPRARGAACTSRSPAVALAGVVATAFAVSTSRARRPDASPNRDRRNRRRRPSRRRPRSPRPRAAAPSKCPPVPTAASHQRRRAPPRTPVAEEHLRNASRPCTKTIPASTRRGPTSRCAPIPRGVRAKFLLADALLKSGDLDRGCGLPPRLK